MLPMASERSVGSLARLEDAGDLAGQVDVVGVKRHDRCARLKSSLSSSVQMTFGAVLSSK